jgi:hypothetical protein
MQTHAFMGSRVSSTAFSAAMQLLPRTKLMLGWLNSTISKKPGAFLFAINRFLLSRGG